MGLYGICLEDDADGWKVLAMTGDRRGAPGLLAKVWPLRTTRDEAEADLAQLVALEPAERPIWR